MTSKRDSRFDLRAAVRDRGFTPRGADRDALLALLADDEDTADHAERALALLGVYAGREALARATQPDVSGRARLVRAAGRIAATSEGAELREGLAGLLSDADEKVRRAAARALGAAGDRRFAPQLLARAESPELEVTERKALVAALGKLGDPSALAAVADVARDADDAELRRVAEEAALRLSRDAVRAEGESTIDGTAPVPHDVTVLLTCRAGFDDLLVDEALALLDAKRAGPGRARGTLQRGSTLDALRGLRTAARLELLGGEARIDAGDVAAAAAIALASRSTHALLRAVTSGSLRYRLEWPGGAHRRADTFRVALEASRLRPELVNDPRDAPWEARLEIEQRAGVVRVWLSPKALPDARFDYLDERADGASHPTVAAALARLGGARAEDVVWDPFCGAGTELVERARLGPYARLLGTDLDERIAALARTTLSRAGVLRASIHHGDALVERPQPAPTLVVTNPPLGRRVGRDRDPGTLLCDLAAHLPDVLAPGARVVWLSPQPDRTARALVTAGFRVTDGIRVDLGGIFAERQVAVLD
jgi:23S rRNA G2445 N2-methylase RlmL